MQEPQIDDALVAAHGLKPDEYLRILQIIGRVPSFTELGIFSAMWNEHCSYKSSKKWLRTLPTTGPQVICGPGENAGVVDIGDGQAVGVVQAVADNGDGQQKLVVALDRNVIAQIDDKTVAFLLDGSARSDGQIMLGWTKAEFETQIADVFKNDISDKS